MKKNDAEKHPDPHKIGALKPSELLVGTQVRYHRVLPKREGIAPIDTEVTGEPWQLGDGTWVASIKARAGGVSTQFLEPI